MINEMSVTWFVKKYQSDVTQKTPFLPHLYRRHHVSHASIHANWTCGYEWKQLKNSTDGEKKMQKNLLQIAHITSSPATAAFSTSNQDKII